MGWLSPEDAWCLGVVMLAGAAGFLVAEIIIIIYRKR